MTKQDILESSGFLQVCTEHKSGSETAVHAMNSLLQHEEADAVLLVDVSNAFNTINRATALHNISVLCPALAIDFSIIDFFIIPLPFNKYEYKYLEN